MEALTAHALIVERLEHSEAHARVAAVHALGRLRSRALGPLAPLIVQRFARRARAGGLWCLASGASRMMTRAYVA